MSGTLRFDEDAARRVEALYQTPDVIAQRREVLRVLDLRPGERVLDIGSGPGLLAREMAEAVGPTGRVSGIDMSEAMLAMARSRCAGQPWVGFQLADATRLPFPNQGFDVAVSTQVYEYVGDIATALAELNRVLRPGGRALILDTDWDSIVWNTNDRGRMERVLAAWDEHLAHPHLPGVLAPLLGQAGFQVQHREVVAILNPEFVPHVYSYGIMGLIASFVAGRRGVTKEEADAWIEELRRLGESGSYFFSLNRYLFLAIKPDTAASREAAMREEAKHEAARLETARLEAAVKEEALRLEAVKQETARLEAAAKHEAAGLEAVRREAAQLEAALRQEALRLEAAKHEAARLEAAAREETARLEAAREEVVQIEAAIRLETLRLQTVREEVLRLEAARQEAMTRGPAGPEPDKPESAKPEPAKPSKPKRVKPPDKDDPIIWRD